MNLDEGCEPGQGFLAMVCQAWEDETRKLSSVGVWVVNARFGLVLDSDKGVLPRMTGPFRLGLGGRFGGGRQFMSWIALNDFSGGPSISSSQENFVRARQYWYRPCRSPIEISPGYWGKCSTVRRCFPSRPSS